MRRSCAGGFSAGGHRLIRCKIFLRDSEERRRDKQPPSEGSLVAGAGFEPAVPQARDYEPDFCLKRLPSEGNLVAGAGFEPAVRRLPDYEPDFRLRPVIE